MIFKTFLPFLLLASSVASLQIAPYRDYDVEKRELTLAPGHFGGTSSGLSHPGHPTFSTGSESSLYTREKHITWPQYDQDPDHHLVSISNDAAVHNRIASAQHKATADGYFKAAAVLASSGRSTDSKTAYELAHDHLRQSNNHRTKADIHEYWANHSLPAARTPHEHAERKMQVQSLIDTAHRSDKEARVSSKKARSQERRITQRMQNFTRPPPPPVQKFINPYEDYRK